MIYLKVKRPSLWSFSLTLCLLTYSLFVPNTIQAQKTLKKPLSLRFCGEIEEKTVCQYNDHYLTTKSGKVHDKSFEVVDRFGRTHCKKIPLKKQKPLTQKQSLTVPFIPTLLDPDYVSPQGLFAVYLSTNTDSPPPAGMGFASNAAARNTVAQVFADLEQLIVENPNSTPFEPVKFNLSSAYFNSPALASATSYYDHGTFPAGTIINGEVWRAINLGNNASDEWDGRITVNFFHTLRTEVNAGQAGGGYDLYSTLLHEVMHALGFASGIDIDGSPRNNNAFLPFDNLLHTQTGNNLIDAQGNFITAQLGSITSGCPSDLHLGVNDRNIFAPSTFASGTSLSHIDVGNNCNFPLQDYVMSPVISLNTPRRLHPHEFDLLCELGYDLSASYGNPNIVEFSNPATVTSLSNISNVIAYSGCAPSLSSVVGVNDYAGAGAALTVQNCQGVSIDILESDLLSNDVSSLGLPLQINNIVATEGTLTTTGQAPNRTFTYTPSSIGNVQLMYQPIDNAQNLGNNTYVFITVTSCPGFDCTNTDPCNLICNPEVVDFGNCNSGNCISLQISGGTDCSSPNNIHIPGWESYFFSPDWMPNSTFNSCEINNWNLNTELLPNATGGRFSFFSSQVVNPGENRNLLSEVLTTNINFQPNTRYLLSYHKIDGYDNSSPAPANPGLQVCLMEEFNPTPFILRYSHTAAGVSPASSESVDFDLDRWDLIVDNTVGDSWSQTVLDFTTASNSSFQYLCFHNPVDSSFLIGNQYATASELYFTQLDRFELIEDRLQDLPSNYSVSCGASANIGIPLCSVSNMTFEWWDATNNVQLTAGNTILNASPLGTYVVTTTNTNGSTIGISDIYNAINLELRRVIPTQSVNGIAITNAIPNANNVASTTIDVIGGGSPTDASFTFVVDQVNCADLTFQANSTNAGETHSWDFQNDGTVDATGDNINFVFPGLGSYDVVHIVSNSCGSIQDTVNVTISNCVIPVNCSWPKYYGANTSLLEEAKTLVVDNNENVFVQGLVDGSVAFENGTFIPGESFLAKYDSCGTLLWVKDIQAYGRLFSTMKIDNQGNPMLLSTTATGTTDSDISYHLTKFSGSTGNVIWSNSIEQWKCFITPSFDINMNTNDVYLAANVSKYSRIKQANGTYVINYTAPVQTTIYPKDQAFLIRFNSSGMAIWSDKLIAYGGNAHLLDVVVAENTNRVFVLGSASDNSFSVGNIVFNSNSSLSLSPTVSSGEMFITAYNFAGNAVFANLYPVSMPPHLAAQIEFSNTDNQIYVANADYQLHLFDINGTALTSVNMSTKVGLMHFDQAANRLIAGGSATNVTSIQTGVIKINKYAGANQVWSYVKNALPAKATISAVYASPVSDRIYFTGMFWDGDFPFNSSDVMLNAGGKDAYVARITDQGSSATYKTASTPLTTDETLPAVANGMESFSVFPNPSDGIFHVMMDANQESNAQIEVYDYSGKLILQQVSSSSQFTVDLSTQPKGIFLLLVKKSGVVYTERIVRQ